MAWPVKPTGHSPVGESLSRALGGIDSPFLRTRRDGVEATKKGDTTVYRASDDPPMLLAWALSRDSTFYVPALMAYQGGVDDLRPLAQRVLKSLSSAFPATWVIGTGRAFEASKVIYLGDNSFAFTLATTAGITPGTPGQYATSTAGYVGLRAARTTDGTPPTVQADVNWISTAPLRGRIDQLHEFSPDAARAVAFSHHADQLVEASTGFVAALGLWGESLFAVLGRRGGDAVGVELAAVQARGAAVELPPDGAAVIKNAVTCRIFNSRSAVVDEVDIWERVPAVLVADQLEAGGNGHGGGLSATAAVGCDGNHGGTLVVVGSKAQPAAQLIDGSTIAEMRALFAAWVSADAGRTWTEVAGQDFAEWAVPDDTPLTSGSFSGGPRPEWDDKVIFLPGGTTTWRLTYVGSGKYIFTTTRWQTEFSPLWQAAVFMFEVATSQFTRLSWPADSFTADQEMVPTQQHVSMCFGPGCMYHPVQEAGRYTVLFTRTFGSAWQRSGQIPAAACQPPGGLAPHFVVIKPSTAEVDGTIIDPGTLWLIAPTEAGSAVWQTDGTFAEFKLLDSHPTRAFNTTPAELGSLLGWHAIPVGSATNPAHTHPGLPRGT